MKENKESGNQTPKSPKLIPQKTGENTDSEMEPLELPSTGQNKENNDLRISMFSENPQAEIDPKPDRVIEFK